MKRAESAFLHEWAGGWRRGFRYIKGRRLPANFLIGETMVGPYDSPTFLGSKDKLLLGMTMMQVGAFLLSAIMWFMVAFSLDLSMTQRLFIFGPAHVLTVVFATVRVGGGLMIPVYFMLMVRSLVITPLYHGTGSEVRGGLPEWLEEEIKDEPVFAYAARPKGGTARKFFSSMRLFGQGAARHGRSQRAEEARNLAALEMENRASDAAHGAKNFIRQGIRMLKGGRF